MGPTLQDVTNSLFLIQLQSFSLKNISDLNILQKLTRFPCIERKNYKKKFWNGGKLSGKDSNLLPFNQTDL